MFIPQDGNATQTWGLFLGSKYFRFYQFRVHCPTVALFPDQMRTVIANKTSEQSLPDRFAASRNCITSWDQMRHCDPL
ncbi:hypothetical protein CPB86DRAFT_508883 [Serendipita vermifera]|nr:hypothetical protein CPB86DRAFT_508883 [Serendipita vermifera]